MPIHTAAKGDLSHWVFLLHGFSPDTRTPGRYEEVKADPTMLSAVGPWLGTILGPRLEPKTVKLATEKSEEIKAELVRGLMELPETERMKALNVVLPHGATKLMEAWSFPSGFRSTQGISAEDVRQKLRAFRAVAVCLHIHKAHVLTLISRSFRGDRRAVLDLVKVDKMFLHDPCTISVIKSAEMLNDHNFLAQLARAQEYKFRVSLRGVHHLYSYLLIDLEHGGLELPTMQELSRILDPHGQEYTSLQSFERDFQRRREIGRAHV